MESVVDDHNSGDSQTLITDDSQIRAAKRRTITRTDNFQYNEIHEYHPGPVVKRKCTNDEESLKVNELRHICGKVVKVLTLRDENACDFQPW